MSLAGTLGARKALRLLSAAGLRHGALLPFPSKRLHTCCGLAARGQPPITSGQQRPEQQQQQQQQRRRQRRRASSSLAEPLAVDDTQPRHAHARPPALGQHPQGQQQHHHGAIEIVVGPMFAGKSTELLRRVAKYEAQGLKVAVVKSDKDNRYCSASVVTHSGVKRPCYAAPTLAAFKAAAGEAYAGFHVIAVDEAQFFPDLHDFCCHAADHEHKRLVLAGLDGDFQRQRFGQVLDLLPMADSVTKLTAHCKFCAQEQRRTAAVFSLRIAADSRQELVGGADVYAPVCRRHYVQLSAVRHPEEEGAEASGAAEQGHGSSGRKDPTR